MRFFRTPYNSAGEGDFLGPDQWAWFVEELQTPADAIVVVSSLQLLEGRGGAGENWGRFPAAQRRFLDALARTETPLVVISGDVHMAEISAARCGAKTLVDVTSSGMTHSWARQHILSGPRRHVGPLMTAAMRLAQALLPHEYQVLDEATGARLNFLDLNFGELEFDFETRTLTARVFGEDGPALERSFPLDALGVAGACISWNGRLPGWRHAVAKALLLASVLAMLFFVPASVAAVLWRAYTSF
mmetsp:Transcript_26920/g.82870  ORF Transcript_26920/g.82870 Transcript_26920/m.82870 type:complete len:245 (-) Transcript_26920:147-881(-)